jgi:hypothetical protein
MQTRSLHIYGFCLLLHAEGACFAVCHFKRECERIRAVILAEGHISVIAVVYSAVIVCLLAVLRSRKVYQDESVAKIERKNLQE